MSTEAQKKAQKKYAASNTITISIQLNLKTDADIIDELIKQENRQGYIKDAIRKKMRAGN